MSEFTETYCDECEKLINWLDGEEIIEHGRGEYCSLDCLVKDAEVEALKLQTTNKELIEALEEIARVAVFPPVDRTILLLATEAINKAKG